MKIILSGEDELKLRRREYEIVSTTQAAGAEITRFDLFKQKREDILEVLGTIDMFAQPKLFIAVNLEKLRSPKQQSEYIHALAQNPNDIVLSINKEPTPGLKKQFDPAIWKTENFPLPKKLFQFLENILVKPYPAIHQLYRESLENGSEWGIHALLTRQLHSILLLKTGLYSGPPFLKAKLEKQANQFSDTKLKQAIEGLFAIEYGIKSGQSKVPWSLQFDILLAELYDVAHE